MEFAQIVVKPGILTQNLEKTRNLKILCLTQNLEKT